MRTDLIKLIRDEAPPKPACFDNQAQWVEFLVGMHANGGRVVRRVDTGKSAGNRKTCHAVLPVGQQSHCQECAKGRRERMEGEGRCFPVRPPERAKPQAPAEPQARSNRFEVNDFATLQSVRVRRGTDEDRTLAVVLGVRFPRVDASVCAYFDELLCSFLFRQTIGGRVVRNQALRPVAYAHQLKDALVEIDRSSFPRADVGHFVVSPIDGTSVALECRITLYPGRANFSQLLGRYREGVRLRIVGAPDLFDDAEPEQKPKSQAQSALV